MVHECHARGCGVAVRPELLMCAAHWRIVPARIKAAVWANYRVGQCSDKKPSKAWHDAADEAIKFVAAYEATYAIWVEWRQLRTSASRFWEKRCKLTSKNKTKTDARTLQNRTGWSYNECLRCVRELTPDAIDALILLRVKNEPSRK